MAAGVAAWPLAAGANQAGAKRVVVALPPGIPAYAEAAAAAKEELLAAGIDVVGAPASDRAHLASRTEGADLVIAVGRSALRRTLAGCDLPVAATMGLAAAYRREAEQYRARLAAAVSLDVPFSVLLPNLRSLAPHARRLGVLRRQAGAPSAAEFENQAARAGFRLDVAECAGPEDLMDAFGRLQARSDIVWCPPEEGLYTKTTVKPLILASLRSRVGVIGFSSGLVHAGAVAGVVPDFGGVGRQTGALAGAFLASGEPTPSRPPEKFRLLLNRRVMRILGLAPPEAADRIEVIG